MELRQKQEEIEGILLSPFAKKSVDSKGRLLQEEKCDIRTEFQRDRDRIIHSKAFRRMKHKTQVFISPEGDHYRTRLTHTLEVAQIARTISRALDLNEDLTESIALGHDLGHTPFGHAGESVLQQLCPHGFSHNLQSVRVVDKLEKDGEGLNLTWETRDGIQNHRSNGMPETLEGKVVRLADKIAYVNHDIDDALRAGTLSQEQLPKEVLEVMGKDSSQRINTCIRDVIVNSQGVPEISMGNKMQQSLQVLRKFMFQAVYEDVRAGQEKDKVDTIISALYYYYIKHPEQMHGEFSWLLSQKEPAETVACDYIAGMTDRFAIKQYTELFMPKSWGIY